MGFLSTVFPFFNPLQTAQDVASGDFGGMGGDNTQTVTNAPWGPMQPYLLQGYGAAENMFFNPQGAFTGLGPAYPDASYIARFNPLQRMGQQELLNSAGGISPYINMMQGAYQQGVNPFSNPFVSGTSGTLPMQQATLASLMGNQIAAPNASAANPFAGASLNLDPQTQQALSNQLSGRVDEGTFNPLINATVREAAESFMDEVAPTLRRDAILTGNYGTPKSADAYAKAFDRMQENILNTTGAIGAGAYENALNRQAGAMGLSSGLAGTQAGFQQQAGLANQANQQQANIFNAAQNLAGQQARAGTALNAAGQVANTSQGYLNPLLGYSSNMFGQTPTMMNMMMQPGNIMNQVGAQQQALSQQQLSEQLQRYQMNRAAPAQDLGMYLDLLRGGPAYTEQSQTTANNPLAALLGMGAVAGGFMMGGPAGGAAAMQAAPNIYQLAGGGYGQPGPWAGNYNYPGGM